MPDIPPVPMEALASCFSGKRVLVTGHTGFKGCWLSLWLERMGADVIGVALEPPPGPSMFESVGLAELIDHRIGDVRSADDFERATEGVDADLVMHLAAQSLVRPSYDDPVDTFATNVTGVFLTIEALLPNLRAAGGKVAIISSQMGSSERAGGNAFVYRASKAAALNLGRNLAVELSPDVAVGIYHPGWVQTDMGGPSAAITVNESATGLIQRFDALGPKNTGCFEMWNGEAMPF